MSADETDPTPALARRVVELLAARAQTVATCESLTGGLVGGAITAVAGSSAVYRGGLVTYATELKVALAGVPADVTERGVVTAECAAAMAAGVRRACGADWGIATTGVAGPGSQDGVPAGTVWVAVDGPLRRQVRLRLPGDRRAVRAGSVTGVLELLVSCAS